MKTRKKPKVEPLPFPHGEPFDDLAAKLQDVGQWIARALTHGIVVCSGCKKTVDSSDKRFKSWRYLGAIGWACHACLSDHGKNAR